MMNTVNSKASTVSGGAIESGGQTKNSVTDIDGNDILKEILYELKKMNYQLSLITDDEINGDIL